MLADEPVLGQQIVHGFADQLALRAPGDVLELLERGIVSIADPSTHRGGSAALGVTDPGPATQHLIHRIYRPVLTHQELTASRRSGRAGLNLIRRRQRNASQTPNSSGGLDVELHAEITLSAEQWIEAVVLILEMLPGKTNDDANAFLLGPVGVDPDMVGALVASRIKEQRQALSR